MIDIDSLLDGICENYSLRSGSRPLNLFMLSCIEEYLDSFPKAAIDLVRLAKEYWLENSRNAPELIEGRIKCWEEHDSLVSMKGSKSSEVTCMRIVICVLYENIKSGDLIDHLEWFIEIFSMHFPDSDSLILQSLQIHFPRWKE